MAITVKKIPLTRQVGSMSADRVQAADTPFQRFKLPDLGAGNVASLAGEAGFKIADGIEEFQTAASRAKYDAALVTADLNISEHVTSTAASWRAPAVDKNGVVNSGNATGANANTDNWVETQMTNLDTVYTDLKKGDNYNGMNSLDKAALDKWYAAQKKSYRASAVTHNTTASAAYLTEQLAASTVQSGQIAEGLALQPAQAHITLKKMMSTIDATARASGNSGKDPQIQVQKAKALDAHAITVIGNILGSGATDAVAKATQWMATNSEVTADGQTTTLTVDTRKRLNRDIELGKAGLVNRTRGDELFKVHGTNELAAMAVLKRDNPGLSDADFEATKEQYKEALRMYDANEARVKKDNMKSLEEKASNGHIFSDAELQGVTGEEAKALKAQSLYTRAERETPTDVPTDYQTNLAWNMKTPSELAAIPVAEFLVDWLPKFGIANGDRDKIVGEYNKARTDVGVQGVKVAKASKEETSKEAAASLKYFNTQLNNRAEVLGSSKALTKTQLGMLKLAANREFKERNDAKPMTSIETDKLLLDLTSGVLLKEEFNDDEATLGTFLADFTDEDGDAIKGSAEISTTLRSIPAADRFEMIQWYRRSGGAPMKDGQINLTGFDDFIALWGPTNAGGLATVSDIPRAHRVAIMANIPADADQPDKRALKMYRDISMGRLRGQGKGD